MRGSPGLALGSRAPDFQLDNQYRARVRLQPLLREGPVVLYFFPGIKATGCAEEAVSLQEARRAFREHGATVLAISPETPLYHAFFAVQHSLSFSLLSDAGGQVASSYGVRDPHDPAAARISYALDEAGIVRHVFASDRQTSRHSLGALHLVRQLAAARRPR
jgi:thioredoxin-dependent peroxiredoxin